MPDGAPLPPDVERDDIAKADRTIEAIAERVYAAGRFLTSFYDLPWSSREAFKESLARELAPVRRVRDRDRHEWFEINGKLYLERRGLSEEGVDEDFGPLTELPPAFVGKPAEAKPLDVKAVAAELYAAVHNGGDSRDYYLSGDGWANDGIRQRFELAISRLMGGCSTSYPHPPHDYCDGKPDAYRTPIVKRTVAELLAAAIEIVGERHDAYLAAKNWPKVREYTDCLESLYEAMDQAAVKDSEIPF